MPSVFDIFKLGVGPSSSHTMRPMTAAQRFIQFLTSDRRSERVHRVTITLYGSLALTGRGHATDRGVMLGLLGFTPANAEPEAADKALNDLLASRLLSLTPTQSIEFNPARDIVWDKTWALPHHANGMVFQAFDQDGAELCARTYFSIGGGTVCDEMQMTANASPEERQTHAFPFNSAAELLSLADAHGFNHRRTHARQ